VSVPQASRSPMSGSERADRGALVRFANAARRQQCGAARRGPRAPVSFPAERESYAKTPDPAILFAGPLRSATNRMPREKIGVTSPPDGMRIGYEVHGCRKNRRWVRCTAGHAIAATFPVPVRCRSAENHEVVFARPGRMASPFDGRKNHHRLFRGICRRGRQEFGLSAVYCSATPWRLLWSLPAARIVPRKWRPAPPGSGESRPLAFLHSRTRGEIPAAPGRA